MFKKFNTIHHYLIYSLAQLFLLMTIISLFTSVHFFMGHDFSVTESWLSGNGWFILIIAKITSFIMYFYFYNIQYYKNDKKMFNEIFKKYTFDRHPFVLSLVGYFIFGYFLKKEGADIAIGNLYNFIIAIFGMSLHFLLDFIFIKSFSFDHQQITKTSKVILSILFSLFFFLVTNAHYSIENVVLMFIIFISLLNFEINNNYFSYFILLCLIVSPLLILVGADPFLSFDAIFTGERFSLPYWSIILFLLIIFLYDFRIKKGLRSY